MDVIALTGEVSSAASFSVAFAKYDLERRAMHADDNMRNNNLSVVYSPPPFSSEPTPFFE